MIYEIRLYYLEIQPVRLARSLRSMLKAYSIESLRIRQECDCLFASLEVASDMDAEVLADTIQEGLVRRLKPEYESLIEVTLDNSLYVES